jgi:hypothetical protein
LPPGQSLYLLSLIIQPIKCGSVSGEIEKFGRDSYVPVFAGSIRFVVRLPGHEIREGADIHPTGRFSHMIFEL